MMVKNLNKERGYFILLSVVFLVIYGLFSLVPHWNFETNALDLGIFNQQIYLYSHLDWGPNTVRSVATLLADHFELILFPLSFLYWVLGSYSLLVVQIMAVILGGTGVYLLVKKETKNGWYGLLAAAAFYSYFAIYDALSFDYHNDVLGYMLLPWLFYLVSCRRWGWYYIVLVICLFCKETMALVTSFWGISILLFDEKEVRKHGWVTLIISVWYFLGVVRFLIPYFNQGEFDHLLSFGRFGGSITEILWNMITHPVWLAKLLFDDGTKLRMWGLILLSGGILAIFKPKYSWLALPIIAQKFFSENVNYWTHFFHYSVGLAPIIVVGASMAIYSYFQSDKVRKVLFGVLLMANLVILVLVGFYDGSNVWRIFSKEYYQPKYNHQNIVEAVEMIPDGDSVSAQNSLVPHLASRDEIYLFPAINDANYVIVVLESSDMWPIDNQKSLRKIKRELLDDSGKYDLIYDKEGVYLYHRSTQI
ncbi:DUF2079 domain-containing protein [Patescibacteria group bacterium]|nr:DUF2079 domain-containing protein [Patescibacteria group bacterium]